MKGNLYPSYSATRQGWHETFYEVFKLKKQSPFRKDTPVNFLIHLIVGGLVFLLLGFLTPGVSVSGLLPAMLAALVYSFFASLLGVAGKQTPPAGHGLLSFLVAGIAMWFAAALVPGFSVSGYLGSLLAVLVLGILQILLARSAQAI